MTSKERVQRAMDFQRPDRVPRYWFFWPEFETCWRERFGAGDLMDHFGNDMILAVAEESPWPGRAGVVAQRRDGWAVRSGWGEVKLSDAPVLHAQMMGALLEPALTMEDDPAALAFESPHADSRYEKTAALVATCRDDSYVMAKVGGPYLRPALMIGEEALWLAIAADPSWTRALVERVTDHLIAIGLESLRRFNLYDTGLAIYDDVASNAGVMVGPRHYEQLFLPALRRMVRAFKDAGAARVMHHSDGNVSDVLDMWLDAGIDAINPVEFRSGMDPVRIREKYGRRLVCVGGLDNAAILPSGDRRQIRDHVLHLLTIGEDGGFIIGPHSVGPDITPETMQYILDLLNEHAGAAASSL